MYVSIHRGFLAVILSLFFVLNVYSQGVDSAVALDIAKNSKSTSKPFLKEVQIVEPASPASLTASESAKALASNISNADDDMQGPFVINDENLDSILTILETLFKKSIIRAQGLPEKNKFNFNSKRKMNRDDAIMAFRALLSLNGVAIVPIDDKFLKAVPSANVSNQIPEFLQTSSLNLPPSQDFYTKFFELENVNVEDFQPKLKTVLSMNNASAIEVFPKSNAFLITDSLLNIQRIEELLKRLDVSNEQMQFIQIKKTSAEDIKARISALKSDRLKNIILDVDARTNKLIVIGNKSVFEYVETIVNELDVESEPILRSEVVYIRHGEAAKVVEVVRSIVSGQKQSKDLKTSRDVQLKSKNIAEQKQSKASAASPEKKDSELSKSESNENLANEKLNQAQGLDSSGQGGEQSSGVEFSDYVQIVGEERSNAVVVYGTPLDIRQVRDIIDKLDIVLMQVKIDVIITEVVLSSDQVSGLSSFGLSFSDISSSGTASGFSGNTQTSKLTNSSTPAFSVYASESGFSTIFDLAREKQNIRILSSPTIVTTHNKDGEVNISQSLPIITGSMNNISDINTTRSTVEYKDIGIKLLVKPLVGKDGTIQLDIDQSVDSIYGYTTIDNNQQPVISKRKAKSFVSVRSGEVIVMAGLQQTDTTEIEGGVWLLGDLPLIGEVFRPTKNESKRRELIIFIRPTVVESSGVEDAITRKEIDDSEAKTELKNFLEKGRFHPNNELEKKAKEFEKNRPYNRLNPVN